MCVHGSRSRSGLFPVASAEEGPFTGTPADGIVPNLHGDQPEAGARRGGSASMPWL